MTEPAATTTSAAPAPKGKALSRVLVALSLVLYGLIVGTVGGIVVARLAGYPGSPGVSPASDVPRASDGFFKGVTRAAIEQAMTKEGYSCSRPPGRTTSPPAVCKDTRTAGYDISLSIEYQADGRVTSLTGQCRPTSSTATVESCGAFIGRVPSLLYPANVTRARAAQDWASQNLGADTSTVIEGVYYVMQLQPLLIVCMPAA